MEETRSDVESMASDPSIYIYIHIILASFSSQEEQLEYLC